LELTTGDNSRADGHAVAADGGHNEITQLVATVGLTVLGVHSVHISDGEGVTNVRRKRASLAQSQGGGLCPARGQNAGIGAGVDRGGAGIRTKGLCGNVLIHLPVHTGRVTAHHAFCGIGIPMRSEATNKPFKLSTIVAPVNGSTMHERRPSRGAPSAVQVSLGGQVGQQRRGGRASSANDVSGVQLGHGRTVKVNFVGYGGNGRLQHTVREHIQRQSQVLGGELGINVELGGQRDRHAGFVEIFNVQRRASCTDEATRTADVQCGTDFCTGNSELVIIVALRPQMRRSTRFPRPSTLRW